MTRELYAYLEVYNVNDPLKLNEKKWSCLDENKKWKENKKVWFFIVIIWSLYIKIILLFIKNHFPFVESILSLSPFSFAFYFFTALKSLVSFLTGNY